MNNFENKYPEVSFIIPTLNEERRIGRCLERVVSQQYPRDKIDIYVVDGGSKDRTRQIAKRYGAIVLDNPRIESDSAKFIALKRIETEYVVLLDADNYLKGAKWLRQMLRPLVENSELFGMESHYFSKRSWGLVNEYLILLHIGDPLARAFAAKLKRVNRGYYTEYEVPKGDVYPVGADGFIWRKSVLDEVGIVGNRFAEANMSYKVYQSGYRKFGRIKDVGIYHDYCRDINTFVKKRIRIAQKNVRRMKKGKNTWVYSRHRFRLILAVLYCISIVGPFLEGVINFFRSGKISWFLHPVLSFITAVVYISKYISLYIFNLPENESIT